MNKESIPKQAKKMFKGIIFDVYQWRQKLYDGNYTTYEKLKRLNTVSIIPVTTKGKIILTKEEQPGKKQFLSVPGGLMKKTETAVETAERELLEETGYKAKKFILLARNQPSSMIEWTKYLFLAKGCTKVSKPKLDSGEKIKLKIVTFKEFINLVIYEILDIKEISLYILKAKINPQKYKNLIKLFEEK